MWAQHVGSGISRFDVYWGDPESQAAWASFPVLASLPGSPVELLGTEG